MEFTQELQEKAAAAQKKQIQVARRVPLQHAVPRVIRVAPRHSNMNDTDSGSESLE